MLTKTELINLNNQMLSLGRPDDRDDMGYNKPDYSLMYNLAYIPAESLRDEYVAVLVDTLNHYSNTQLKAYSEELRATWEHYSSLLQRNQNKDFFGYVENRDTSFLKNANEEWLPKDMKRLHYNVISIAGCNGSGLYLSFEDTRAAHTFKNVTDGVYFRQIEGEWKLFVPYEHLKDFVDLMSTTKKKGIDGYVPSEPLKEILENVSAFAEKVKKEEHEEMLRQQKEEWLRQQSNRIVTVVNTDFDKNNITVYFGCFSPEMNSFKNEHSSKIKVFNEDGKWYTKIAFSLVDDWKVKASSAGLFLSEELKIISSDKLKKTAEMKKQQEEEALKQKHMNHNSLIDLNTIPLPFKPFDFQIEDANRLLERDRMLLGHEMGCVSGNSKVRIMIMKNRAVREVQVSKLQYMIDYYKDIQICCLIDNQFGYKPIKAVLEKGVQETICVRTRETFIECTKDHEIYTPNGFVEAGKLFPDDRICIYKKYASRSPRMEKITAIEPAETQVVYDIAIDDPYIHNFLCNRIIVHNCGKTFISGLVGASIQGKKLVICPESLRLNWQRELNNIGQEANILYSKDKFAVSENQNSFTIVGYKTAAKFHNELLNAGFATAFVDEVHNCKAVDVMGRAASQRAAAVIDIVRNTKYAYLLSGTPIPTSNKDLFNVLKMLDVKEIDFNEKFAFFKYGQEFCDGYNNGFGWQFDGNSNSEELHNLLTPYMVRRLKKDVLPDLMKQRICIPLEIHNREYNKIEKRIKYPQDGDTYMGLAMTGRRLLSESKVADAIEFADGLLKENKSVVIVSNFNDTLDTLKEKYKDNCCVIRGGMSDAAKQKSVDDFQSGKCKVCALNIIAGGVGITLTKAHDMIICDYDWTPANMVQVEDRICRAGQTEPCNIHYLYGDGCIIDELFIKMITDKNANIDRVIDNTENTMNLSDKFETVPKSYIDLLKEYAEKAVAEEKETKKKVKKNKNKDTEIPR